MTVVRRSLSLLHKMSDPCLLPFTIEYGGINEIFTAELHYQ
jgi:hypothetical protein